MRPTTTAWGVLGVLLALLAAPSSLEGQLGAIDWQTPLCGNTPQSAGADLTYDNGTNRLWILDQASGQVCRYALSAFPPDILFSLSINHPFGAAAPPSFTPQCTGLAFRSTTQTLFVLNATTNQIWEFDQTGAAIGAPVSLSPPLPDASLSGLAYDTVTGNLWYRDTVNDIAVQCVPSTGATVSFIELPGESPMFGSGLAFTATGGTRFLEFTVGNVLAYRPSKVLRINAVTGAVTNVEVPLWAIPDPVIGTVRPPTGTVIYVTTADDVYKIEAAQPATLPPTDLACYVGVTGTVNLSWRNRGPGAGGLYTSIRILRGGTILQILGGNATSFVDNDPQPAGGLISYTVQGVNASQTANALCSVQTGPGGLVNYTEFGGTRPYDLALDDVSGNLYVTDNFSDLIYVYDTSLNLQSIISTGLPNLQGIAYNPVLDILLVSRGGSTNLTPIDPLSGLISTVHGQLSMPAGSNITGITYDELTDSYLYINAAANPVQVVRVDATLGSQGNPLGSFSPPGTSGLFLGRGISHLAQTDTVLVPVQASSTGDILTSVSELYTNGFPSGFSFPFTSIGGSIAEPNAVQGIEDLANVAYLAGSASNVIFRVLIAEGGDPFIRGEANGAAPVDLADALYIANYLYTGGPAPACLDAADVNDSGDLDISDPLWLILYLFASGPMPPPPFPGAGPDPTFLDPLGC